ncbi:hypothetical protein AB0F81_06080 [Actinoplanes sp. NPDC024001]|uniref:hypothetical protein n=1 Tax=Actinoplanes sp. NPDC024001 TaxID=3154598 RepID=UPI0033F10F64
MPKIVEDKQVSADKSDKPEPLSRHDLYEKAKQRQIPGRSKMSRDQLAEALGES